MREINLLPRDSLLVWHNTFVSYKMYAIVQRCNLKRFQALLGLALQSFCIDYLQRDEPILVHGER